MNDKRKISINFHDKKERKIKGGKKNFAFP
jgi:hypothetical protein